MSPKRIAFLVVLLTLACARSSSPTTSDPGGGEGAGGGTGPGGSTGPSGGSPASLTAACAPASVTAGDEGATCTATLQNSSETITWTLSGPGSLSSGEGASVKYLPPAQLDAEAVAHLEVTAGGLSASLDVQVAAPPRTGLTIAGRAVDPGGHPLEGVGVVVPGGEATTTAADGTFAISGVTPPYDLVLYTQGAGRTVTVYAGLTRADPTVAIYQAGLSGAGAVERTATIAGTVDGGDDGATRRSDYQGVLLSAAALPAKDPPLAWGGAVASPPASYRRTVAWSGGETLEATVLAVQWRAASATASPTAYWLGSADVTLTAGATAKAPRIALAAVPVVTTQGTVSLPPRYRLERLSAQLALANGGPAFPLFYDPAVLAPAFTYVLPVPGGGELRLCARAVRDDPDRADVALGCADVTGLRTVEIPVPPAPAPFMPANGANAVGMDTAFAWQPLEGGVHALEVTPDGEDAPAFLVFTAAARAVLPAVGPGALALPSGATYSWRVRGFGPVSSIDALAAPGSVPLPLDDASPPPGPSAWGRSAAFWFTVR